MPSEEGGARTDRQVSRLISLGGAALIVGQAIPMLQEARDSRGGGTRQASS